MVAVDTFQPEPEARRPPLVHCGSLRPSVQPNHIPPGTGNGPMSITYYVEGDAREKGSSYILQHYVL